MPAITLARPAVAAVAGRTVSALGTFCSVLVTRPAELPAAAEILSAELTAIDLACSRFRPDSELMAVNQARGRPVAVSPLLCQALAVALWAAEITGGDVDPTCGRSLVAAGYDRDYGELIAAPAPSLPPAAGAPLLPAAGISLQPAAGTPLLPAAGWECVDLDERRRTVRVPSGVMLDLGATAKALAADLAAQAAAQQLRCGVLINLGGDIAVAGPPPEGGWQVGIDDGVSPAPAQAVTIEAGGLATSNPSVRAWRRGTETLHHILEPRTGRPVEIYWAATSVAAATCVDANTASTASVIRGRAAVAWLQDLSLPARLARPDGTVVTTGGWPH